MHEKTRPYIRNLVLSALVTGVMACGSSTPQVTATVIAGQDTLVNLQDITFYAPAEGLPDGMEFGFTTEPADDVDKDILGPDRIALSELLTVSFGETPASHALYTVQFKLEPADYDSIAVLTRTIGGLTTDGVTDTGWVPGFGHYDEKTSMYSVTLAATAKQVSMLVYTRTPEGSESGYLQRLSEPLKKSLEIAGSISGISSVSAQELVPPKKPITFAKMDLTSHGWAIRCDPKQFKQDSICTAGSSKLKKMVQLAVQSAENLKKLGFYFVHLRTETLPSLRRTGDVVEFADSADSQASKQAYFTMVMVPQLPDPYANAIALYDPGPLSIYLTPRSDNVTVIHEIQHAVQYAEIDNYWAQGWVIEGTAAAVEPFAPKYQGNRGEAYRYGGDWRNWSVDLNDSSEDEFWMYEVSEYWLSVDPGLSYLPRLFDIIGAGASKVSASGSLDEIDGALKVTAGINLDDSFTQLIETRDGEIEKGYRWCEEIDFTCEDRECPISEQWPFHFEPMTAKCFKVKAEFSDLDCDAPSYKLDLEGDEVKHRFVVDGQRFEADESTAVEEEFRLWVVNLARDQKGHARSEATLKAVCNGPVSIIGQDHSVAVTVSSCEPSNSGSGTCHKNERGINYSSDLIEGTSRITTWENDKQYVPADRQVQDGYTPIRVGQKFERSFDVSVDGGSRAVAQLSTSTRDEEDEFIVEGQFKLQAAHADKAGWGGSANAEVEFTIGLVVGVPAMMYISNCELFEVSGSFKPVKTTGRDCEYISYLDQEMMEIHQNTDYGLLSDMLSAEQMASIKAVPKGEDVTISFRRQQAFSSAESVTGDSDGQFEIRIVYD